jgi:hypothetical protein
MLMARRRRKKNTAWADRPRNRLRKRPALKARTEACVKAGFQKADRREAYLGAEHQPLRLI